MGCTNPMAMEHLQELLIALPNILPAARGSPASVAGEAAGGSGSSCSSPVVRRPLSPDTQAQLQELRTRVLQHKQQQTQKGVQIAAQEAAGGGPGSTQPQAASSPGGAAAAAATATSLGRTQVSSVLKQECQAAASSKSTAEATRGDARQFGAKLPPLDTSLCALSPAVAERVAERHDLLHSSPGSQESAEAAAAAAADTPRDLVQPVSPVTSPNYRAAAAGTVAAAAAAIAAVSHSGLSQQQPLSTAAAAATPASPQNAAVAAGAAADAQGSPNQQQQQEQQSCQQQANRLLVQQWMNGHEPACQQAAFAQPKNPLSVSSSATSPRVPAGRPSSPRHSPRSNPQAVAAAGQNRQASPVANVAAAAATQAPQQQQQQQQHLSKPAAPSNLVIAAGALRLAACPTLGSGGGSSNNSNSKRVNPAVTPLTDAIMAGGAMPSSTDLTTATAAAAAAAKFIDVAADVANQQSAASSPGSMTCLPLPPFSL